jgi:hypothetical protein
MDNNLDKKMAILEKRLKKTQEQNDLTLSKLKSLDNEKTEEKLDKLTAIMEEHHTAMQKIALAKD